jgi:hypothetical protein
VGKARGLFVRADCVNVPAEAREVQQRRDEDRERDFGDEDFMDDCGDDAGEDGLFVHAVMAGAER